MRDLRKLNILRAKDVKRFVREGIRIRGAVCVRCKCQQTKILIPCVWASAKHSFTRIPDFIRRIRLFREPFNLRLEALLQQLTGDMAGALVNTHGPAVLS